MAIVNGSLQEGYKDAAWFAANPTLVLLVGQKVNLEQTGTYKLGDGTTQLSALSFLGASGSGLSGLTTNKVLKAGSTTTAVDSNITDDGTTVTVASPNGVNKVEVSDSLVKMYYESVINGLRGYVESDDVKSKIFHDLLIQLNATSVTKNGVEVATINDIPSYPTTYDLFITTGNQSTTSNVAANITDLVSPTLAANKRYKISGVIHFGCNNSGGIKYQITLPAGATIWIMGHSNLTNANTITWVPIILSGTLSASFAGVNAVDYGALCIEGEISISATAGVIQFGFASATNTQTSTVYQLGTQLTLTQIN